MAKKEHEAKQAREKEQQYRHAGSTETVNAGKTKSGKQQVTKENRENAKVKKSGGRKSHSYKEDYEILHDKYLRLSAEFDNYRKRTLREKADLTKFAGEGLLLGLLPVIDDFERALELMPEDESCKAVREGTELIYNKFREYLRQNGVEEIDAMHKEFDTDMHEAVTKIPATDKKLKGKVIDVIQKGYFLNGKVLRFAKVVVGE